MGGMVARRVAIEHPDRVERLVLFGYPRLCRLIASAQWPIR
jgi:pimeloyl-ACP methyl ester carboxylesterase